MRERHGSEKPDSLTARSFSLMIEQTATQADKRALIQRGKTEERRQDETPAGRNRQYRLSGR